MDLFLDAAFISANSFPNSSPQLTISLGTQNKTGHEEKIDKVGEVEIK